MSPTPRLGAAFDRLEDRTMPAAFGTPWADASHLTLSFTLDGTATPTGPSSLFATMSSAGSAPVWQTEILRAFQTWAVNANVNIGLVVDGGQALGTTGAVQGDSRFGDVRVAAAPTSSAALAAATPFGWAGSTFSGDVVFNSAMKFTRGGAAGGYDLYSVALHEAGHVLGLGHENEDAVMNAGYLLSTGLSADEVADLQALYGPRPADAFDARTSNGTLATASALPLNPSTGRYAADADLTTTGDADVYSFRAAATTATVALQAKGLSLLQARVSVYDASGRQLAGGVAASALNNDVTLQVSGLTANASYFVKVEGATADVFRVGAYRLSVAAGAAAGPTPPAPRATPDGHTNDTLPTATSLGALQALSTDARFDATYRGTIEDAADTDYYRIRTPATRAAENLYVMVWATDGALDPRVRVFDAVGQAVPFRVLANDDGLMSVVVPGATSGVYYVQVAGKAGGAGSYVLAADFNRTAPPAVNEVDNGLLSSSTPEATDAVTVGGGLYQFALYTDPALFGTGGVTLTVTDKLGKVLFTLDADSGDPAVTRSVYLPAGTYKLVYTYHAVSGQAAAPVQYHLAVTALSESVGTYAPTTASTAPVTTTTTTTTSPTTSTLLSAPTKTTGTTYTSTTTYISPTASTYFGTWYFF